MAGQAENTALDGFPPGFNLFSLEGMEGLNTKAQRPAIKDQQWSWSQNFIPIGEANARVIWGVGGLNYTAPGGLTIINHAFYNIASDAFGIAFLSDGSAQQFALVGGAVTDVGPASTFWAAGNLSTPTIVQWANNGILIVSTIGADAYWAWDGTLHSPGDMTSPDWLNGGTATPMPTGVAGTAIEIFLSRVWILNGIVRLTSVASNGADFSTGNGGVSAPNTDSSLRIQYTGIKAANGYLYMFGDSSCAYVTNVQTSTTPTTTYQYTVIDPQIGTPWRDSVVPFGRSILFANENGVYALYGSTANKISDDLDGIWNSTVADFATVVPSSSVATMFGIKVFCITLRTTDPTTGDLADFLACFDGKKWFIASQNPAPLLTAPQETNSVLAAYASDGTRIRQMFAQPDALLPKVIVSKLWGGDFGFVARKQALSFNAEVQAIEGTSVEIMLSLDTDAASGTNLVSFDQEIQFQNIFGQDIQFQNNSLQNILFQSLASILFYAQASGLGYGYLLGFTLTTTSPDFVVLRLALGYRNFRGRG